MKPKPHQYPENPRGRRMAPLTVVACSWGLSAAVLFDVAHGDTFSRVFHDPAQDELVVTMAYRGTNPDHTFSLKWGPCPTMDDGSEAEIVAEVLDSQWQDAARQPYKVTTRFSLADLACRPVKLTLRTAPRFYVSLHIPARNS
jgi:hypothetical protein